MGDAENSALIIKEGAAQLFRPYQELLQQLLGPAATEVGGAFGDSLRVWRLRRQLRLLEKVKEMTDGKNINPVAPRLFFPILEAATIEADDEVQSRWAALLANEAVNTNSVHPSFVEILKQMSPADARLLDKIYDWCQANNTAKLQWWHGSPPITNTEENEALENLMRLAFIYPNYELIQGEEQMKNWAGYPMMVYEKPKLIDEYLLTTIAFRFVETCRAPKGEANTTAQSA